MSEHLTLKQVINILKQYPPATAVPRGFGSPHSYRGYYDRLAFSPVTDTTVAEMLRHAKSAEWNSFTGYKGGTFTMGPDTLCYVAEYGECSCTNSDELTNTWLLAMIDSRDPAKLDALVEAVRLTLNDSVFAGSFTEVGTPAIDRLKDALAAFEEVRK